MFHAGSALMIYRDKSYKPVNHDMDIDIQFPFENIIKLLIYVKIMLKNIKMINF